jgi:hypothetical protein
MSPEDAASAPAATERSFSSLVDSGLPTDEVRARTSVRRRSLMYGLMLLPVLVLCAAHWDNLPSIAMTDYAQYLMQAESFLRGEGIMSSRYIYTPLNPSFGPAAYPPGFPATLVPVMAIFGQSPAALKALMIVSLALFVVLVALYFERRTGLAMALVIALFTGLALESLHATQVVLSDVGFCAIIWATILLVDEDDWTWTRVVIVTVLGFAAMSYRAAGVVLIPALLLHAFINRRRLGMRPAIPAVVWGVVLAGAATVLTMTGAGAAVRVPGILAILDRVWTYRWSLLQSHLYPVPWDVFNDVYHAATLLLMVVGLVMWMLRDRLRSFLAVFSLGYFGMLLVAWVASDRYLWPLYPVAVFGLLHGALVVLRGARAAWSEARRERVVVVTAAAVAMLAMVTSLRAPPPRSLLDQPEVVELFDRVRELKKTGSPRIAFSNARVLAWETGVHAMPLIDVNASRGVAEFSRLGITHVIVGDGGLGSWDNKVLGETVKQMSRHFTLEFENQGFALYRFHGGA